MEKNTTYYHNLISRYFAGEVTPDEVTVMVDWIMADPANQKLFEDYQLTWDHIEKSMINSSVDLDKDWNKISTRIRHIEQMKSIETDTDEHPYKVLPLDPERPPMRYNFYTYLRVAAVLLLLLIPAWLIYRNFIGQGTERIVAEHSIVETILPDGTSVSLNTGSTLDYPARFTDNRREVTLNGEAYFDVARNPSKPFVISNGNVRIKALGTAFNVNTKVVNDIMEVVLTRGKVAVYFQGRPGLRVILEPGEKAALSVNRQTIIKSVNPDENYLACKTRKINFSNQALDGVVATLNRVYHTNIYIRTGELNNCRLTATFDHQSLESVLTVLKTTLDITIYNNDSGIELSGKVCN